MQVRHLQCSNTVRGHGLLILNPNNFKCLSGYDTLQSAVHSDNQYHFSTVVCVNQCLYCRLYIIALVLLVSHKHYLPIILSLFPPSLSPLSLFILRNSLIDPNSTDMSFVKAYCKCQCLLMFCRVVMPCPDYGRLLLSNQCLWTCRFWPFN